MHLCLGCNVKEYLASIAVETISIIAMDTSHAQVFARKAHITCLQEHGMSEGQLQATKAAAHNAGWKMEAVPTGPEYNRKIGGVGLVARDPVHPVPLIGVTKAYSDAVDTGRLNVYTVEVDEAATLMIAIIYGWTGASKGNIASNRANDLCVVVQQEFKQPPPGPKML